MAKRKIFGKVLDLIGLEETAIDEDENYDFDNEDDDMFDETPSRRKGRYDEDDFDDEDDIDEIDDRRSAFGRNRRNRQTRETQRNAFESSAQRDREFQDRASTREREPQDFSRENRENKVVGLAQNPNNKMKMIVYQPMTYDDTQNIIDNLKNRKPVIVNLESLEVDIAQRILDFMSGAVYALNGSIHKISKGIFILVPNNVDISGNIPDDLKGKSFYTLGNRSRREY